jgi:thiamine-phosphate pyrophosphorylase
MRWIRSVSIHNYKENLSPILGLEGYQTILNEMRKDYIPVYAIGGIGLDIPALMETGIYGIGFRV